MTNQLRLVLALAGALVALFAISAPHAGAVDDNWQALQVQMVGQGTVTGSGGFACPGPYGNLCSKAYDYGTLVNLAASPSPGWIFGGWSGCGYEVGTLCQVLLNKQGDNRNTDLTATFVPFSPSPSQQPLSVSVSGPGSVTGTGIDCPGDCSQSFLAGAWVTLQAQAQPLASFIGWSGACTGGPTTACVVKMDTARSVTATFATDIPIGQARELVVQVAGAGTGKVASGSAIDCPGDCIQSYSLANEVTLTATPALGSTFAGWSGACSGLAPTCQVAMTTSRSVTATFQQAPAGDPVDPGNPGNPGTPGPGPVAGGTCTITGTPGADVLLGTPGRDVICGLGGNDRLVGKGGDDILDAGAGADLLDGGRGSDRLVGGTGSDRLLGGRGADVLAARDRKRDRLDGGLGRDRARIDAKKDVSRRIESIL